MGSEHGGRWPRRIGSARQTLPVLLVTVVGLSLASPAVPAQTPPPTAGQPDDPLSWRRLDPAALNETVAVEDRTLGRTKTVAGRRLLVDSQEFYVRSAVAAELLQASRLWQAVSRRLTLRVGERDFRFVDGSRLVASDQREMLLPVPVLYTDGDIWLPMVCLTAVLGPEAGLFVRWQAEERRLVLGQTEVNVTELQIQELTRATSLQLVCREPLSFRASSPEAGLIELKLYGGQADLARIRQDTPRGLVQSVRATQREGHTVVAVRVNELVTRYRTHTEQDGRHIVLVLEEEQVTALPEPVPRGAAEIAVTIGPVDVTRRLAIRTVVIDPGHGGSDPGVEGVGGLLEKDINLEVGLRLAEYLRQKGLQVVLTRQDDRHLGLAERAEIANTAGGDLFISLHCNAWYNGAARGLETYFLSPAKSDWSQSVETLENRDHTAADDVEFIVWDLVQNRYISASSDLAEVIQAEVSRDLGLPDRGVRQAGFRVLVGAWMPAVLIEMGFLTHPEDARQLRSDRYQRALARAVGDAILTYRAQVERRVAGMTAGDQR
ncbi:MAG: N-acetylmuramoyl-L-alanine amidase [Candidatus Krumholzibacteria bacterium]|jgi:N-acetylmuramoyl-L-alanine amidase|nr:N-acetylmuramoyl-L-alanine amidase [Candidatus Krumholzibacteria bacterium]